MTEPEFMQRLILGQQLLESSSFDRAIEQFRAVLSHDPANAQAHAMLALALAGTNRLDAAQHEADLALQLEADAPYYHFVKAFTLSAQDKFEAALPSIETAIELDPEEDSYYALQAFILSRLGRLRESEAASRHALDLNPQNDDAYRHLGTVLLEQKRYQEALTPLQQALRLDPESSEPHSDMGLYYLHTGQSDKALQHTREALRIDPTNEAAQHNLVLAMGARNWFYGLYWKWTLFLVRYFGKAQWAAIIGLWVAMQVLRQVARANPAMLPYVSVIGVLYLLFCIYTWTADPIFKWWIRRSQPF
jgi:tetratricopeptide (TPR) repeat protein